MNDIPLNAKVICIDGECGKSSHVIINPLNQTITHIVVENDSLRDSKQRLVPFNKIVETTHKSIQLKCTLLIATKQNMRPLGLPTNIFLMK